MMALLLGAIEAHHEASSQLARASEVMWKWSVFLLAAECQRTSLDCQQTSGGV